MGVLAGAIQATTGWWIFRGRLAEADIMLACLVTWTLVAFDRLRAVPTTHHAVEEKASAVGQHRFWQYVFFCLLGLGALVKGTGFGAVLVLGTTLTVIIWGREWRTLRYLLWAPGWALAGLLALAWPLLMISQHGTKVIGLWVLHISDRVLPPSSHGQFAGETWACYLLNVFGQGLPWTPLAIAGATLAAYRHHMGTHLGVLRSDRNYPDVSARNRLLWSWTTVPFVLVSITRARNAHYAIYAMVPWSFWASIALTHLSTVLCQRGWAMARLKRVALGVFSLLALSYGIGYWLAGAYVSHHSPETMFYQRVGQALQPGEQMTLLYDEWDRDPYYTPFGQIPHDLALRLFYLRHPACWHFGVASLAAHAHTCAQGTPQVSTGSPLLLIGRDRDLRELRLLGNVEVLAYSATKRWDRHYVSLRLRPYPAAVTQRASTVAGSSK